MKNTNWITNNSSISTLPLFRKVFKMPKKAKRALLKITAIGFYDVKINGLPVTESMFKPGRTSYKNRIQYQIFDVTDLLKLKDNVIEVILANGWAVAKRFAWVEKPYFEKAALNADLEILYKDSSTKKIHTDTSREVYTSYIFDSDIYDGETQDLRVVPEYVENASRIEYDVKFIKQEGENIIEDEIIFPRNIIRTPLGETLIDFGQNFAGNLIFEIDSKDGEVLSFLPGEILTLDGNFYNENYRDAKSIFTYTLKDGKNILRPLFSFEGLRYIKLTNVPLGFDINCVKGVAIHSDLKRTCYFDSGNEKLNQLYHNIVWGQLSNYLDVPTDCPQRDERLGWLGDAQVFAKTAAINFDVRRFFTKWLHDLFLDQNTDGSVQGVAPTIPGHDVEISSGWGDAITICPWTIYNFYNDKKILKDAFPHMKMWVDYIKDTGDSPYLWDSGFQFGDRLSIDAPYGSFIGATNVFLVASAFYAKSTEILIKSGKILDYDVERYEELLKNIKIAFREKFLKDGLPIGKKAIEGSAKEQTCYTQAAISIILSFNLCEESDKQKLVNALVELIEMNGGRMTTGFLGTPYILHALSENGRSDIAYKLLLQEKAPSWFYSINNGATTIREHWDGINEKGEFWPAIMNSFNHYSYGAVFDWIFEEAAGIKILEPGFKKIKIEPHVLRELGHLDIKYKTKKGLLSVRWYFRDDATIYEITIPEGTSCTCIINNKEYNLEKGKYMFSHL